MSKGFVFAGWLAIGLAVSTLAGCGSNRSAEPGQAKGTTFASATRDEVFAARFQAMAAADTYATIVAQASDELRAKTKRPEVETWAMEQRVATAIASYTNAIEPNGYVALLDMMVYSTLKSRAVEQHWIPTLLQDEGKPVLEACQRGEQEVWHLGSKVLTKGQLNELRQVIDAWQAKNPTQFYVAFIRFTDFANFMRVSAESSKARSPGSVFGLLYIDPLAGLDPVAREMQEFRAMTERLSYFISRLPMVLSMQVELAIRKSTHDSEMTRFIDNTGKFADNSGRFADATVRFANSIAQWPQHITSERTAAIEQLNTATTQQVKTALDDAFNKINDQRIALTQDLQGHESRLDQTVEKVQGVVDRAREAGAAIKTSTQETVDAAEQSTRRIINRVFLLTVSLIVIILLAMLLYRYVAVKLSANHHRQAH